MKLVCYFTITLGVLAGAYEYNRVTGLNIWNLLNNFNAFGKNILTQQLLSIWQQFRPTQESTIIIFAYFFILYLLTFLAPGYWFQGPPIRDGRVLKFYCNGLSVLFVMIGLYAALSYTNIIKWTICYDHFGPLLFWCLFISFATSTYLFIRGRMKGLGSGKGILEDFVMGQELVPQFLGLHLNFFWLRPSMMLWLFINLSFLVKHYEINGFVSHSMFLYQLFTNIYVIDYFFYEELVTSTWDIIAEKFGFMLVWGDLVFIPFTFTLQTWFLLEDKTFYSPLKFSAMLGLFCLGYAIFRLANKQKHDFKKNPEGLVWGKKPEVLGKRLLVSGFWGLASHINYLGDLLLALSYSAPCGLFRSQSFIPWFYPIYLFLLLIHRDLRDDAKCSKKYGELWIEYRKRVPYRIFPGIY